MVIWIEPDTFPPVGVELATLLAALELTALEFGLELIELVLLDVLLPALMVPPLAVSVTASRRVPSSRRRILRT